MRTGTFLTSTWCDNDGFRSHVLDNGGRFSGFSAVQPFGVSSERACWVIHQLQLLEWHGLCSQLCKDHRVLKLARWICWTLSMAISIFCVAFCFCPPLLDVQLSIWFYSFCSWIAYCAVSMVWISGVHIIPRKDFDWRCQNLIQEPSLWGIWGVYVQHCLSSNRWRRHKFSSQRGPTPLWKCLHVCLYMRTYITNT